MDELKKQIADLEGALKAEQDKCEALQGSLDQESKARKDLRDQLAQITPKSEPSESQAVYISRERKLKVFSGKSATGQQDAVDIAEWVDDVSRYLGSRKWSSAEQSDYIMQHLEGSARDEILYRPDSVKKDPKLILETLKKVFGEPDTLTDLQETFYTRVQNHGESLISYSVSLMKLVSKIVVKAPQFESSKDTMLKGRFIEGVQDSNLQRVLRKENDDNDSITFLDLREKAIKWVGKQKRGVKVNEIGASPQAAEGSDSESDPVMKLLKQMSEDQKNTAAQMEKYVAEMNKLKSMVTQLQRSDSASGNGARKGDRRVRFSDQPNGSQSGRNKDHSNKTCYKCHQRGHLSYDCGKPKSNLSVPKNA